MTLQVYRVTERGQLQFGMVVENSEFVSSDEEGEGNGYSAHNTSTRFSHMGGRRKWVGRAATDTDDDDFGASGDNEVRKGYVRVAWHPRGNEQVVHEKKVSF